MANAALRLRRAELSLFEKVGELNGPLILLILLVAGIGFAMLYSAGDGNLDPWAMRQMVRFSVGFIIMLIIALIDLRVWMRWAYVIYAAALIMLVFVEISGRIGMGAQRWIDLGFFQLQPSEVAKIALVLALARYYHVLGADESRRLPRLVVPVLLVAVPVALVLRQPDLGTAVMMVVGAGAIVFLAGIPLWVFAGTGVAMIAAVPIAWQFMHEYQRTRVLTFLNPENDPLGAGYHILQSKIALGSGGVFGKGFLAGTQSHLSFLPEKQTDFIFTMFAEEFGLIGSLGLLGLYSLIFLYAFIIALRCRAPFGRLMAMGLSVTVFLYVCINIAMVMGLIPVVGVPLPLVSYGGTAMMTILVAMGLLMNVYVHRDTEVPRNPGGDYP